MFDIFRRRNSLNNEPSGSGKVSLENVGEMRIPEGMDFFGGSQFDEVGDEFLGYFKKYCGLRKNASILDVGCGIGRMAIPLTKFLSSEGAYRGFDIVPEGIEWCQNNISTRYLNFEFSHADIYSKQYNASGKLPSENYRFPYRDSTFDFVFLTSVFTHMLSKDLKNYFSEICRVLKPGGSTLITYFILNEESQDLYWLRKWLPFAIV